MAKGRRNNSKRREARQQSAPSRFFDSTKSLRSATGTTINEMRRALQGPAFQASYEPASRLSSYLKQRSTPVDQPSPRTQNQKSKKYTQPNWSEVSQKKIEQPDSTQRTICEERRIRREVMFAINKAGQTGQKTPVWTVQSKKTCRSK